MIDNRLPPHNRDAERSILGTMLRDNSLIPEIASTLKSDHFYVFGHQKIYESIVSLNEKGNNVDIVTVAEWLTNSGKIGDSGGHVYIAELWDAAPSTSSFQQYADIIRVAAMRRMAIHTAHKLIEASNDLNTHPTESLSQAENSIMEISDLGIVGEPLTLEQTLRDVYTRMDHRRGMAEGEVSGVMTGCMDIDRILAGFQPSELILVAARPSVGKSALGLQMAMNAAMEQGLPTLFISLEQSSTELTERILCNQARVDSYRMRTGRLDSGDIERLMKTGDALSNAPLWIDDTPAQNMFRISATARRLKKKKGLSMLMVDYVQLVDPDNHKAQRYEQVGSISRRMKMLAKDLDIPVVCMAQVNRSSEDRRDRSPRLGDLRESGSLEQDADTVILMHRPEVGDPGTEEGLCEINIAKNRNGPTGQVKLLYVKQFMRFENFAMETGGTYGRN